MRRETSCHVPDGFRVKHTLGWCTLTLSHTCRQIHMRNITVQWVLWVLCDLELSGINKCWINVVTHSFAQNIYKYNNAKRSIPMHPTFVNDAHRSFHIWTMTCKINRVLPLTMMNMSAKFDEAHADLVSIVFTSLFPYMSIVTLTFDPWPPQSIGSILSLWLTCLASLMKKHTTV